MAGSRASAKRGLAYGCTGCLAILGIIVLLAAGTVGVAMLKARSEKVEDRELVHEISPGAGAESGGAPAGETAAGAAAVTETGTATGTATAASGKVVLDVSHTEVLIAPSEPGSPLRVEARYDEKAYALEESFETPAGSPWRYTMRFRRTASSALTTLKEVLGGTSPKLRVFLPSGVSMDLEIRVSEGGSEMRFGGLWLTNADLRFEKGGFDLQVDEPLHAPMERLTIHGAMGGFSASRIGNASPRLLDVETRMGGMDLDLRGSWVRDAQISVVTSMGGGAVRLPADVEIRGLDRAGFAPGPPSEPEIGRPVLTFSVSSSMGGLEILD